jgi:hypothetical protein
MVARIRGRCRASGEDHKGGYRKDSSHTTVSHGWGFENQAPHRLDH